MSGFTGATIFLHDFSKSLAERAKSRKLCGPYRYTVPAVGKSEGRGFYFGPSGSMAKHGSFADLRIEEAAPIGRTGVAGYWGDEFGDMVVKPYVIRLPHGRGFLAACGEGAGMWGSVSFTIYEDEDDAKYAAHDEAERAAERNRDAREDEPVQTEDEEDEEG